MRSRLRAGRLVLGEQLMITDLSRELGLSATPIREALSRLAGEGLIEDRRGVGHFAWRLDAIDLQGLYDLQMAYLRGAFLRPAHAWSVDELGVGEVADDAKHLTRTERIHERVIARSRNLWLTRSHRLLADRLAPARRVEPLVLSGLEIELDHLEALLPDATVEELQDAFGGYYGRRVRLATDIIAAMRGPGRGLGSI
ncbi:MULTISPECIES: GntR family transcriptional regulator [unclassified Phenylobacterium]|uniref:GntR family transcriptional regulator n=1 Tax=unclassified Phenylobacterium TaxID=2640670 RepID=UPI0021016DA8|nr:MULTISPECIES: GntR family transcriptional regulator [unclassified Phenylobacterium]